MDGSSACSDGSSHSRSDVWDVVPPSRAHWDRCPSRDDQAGSVLFHTVIRPAFTRLVVGLSRSSPPLVENGGNCEKILTGMPARGLQVWLGDRAPNGLPSNEKLVCHKVKNKRPCTDGKQWFGLWGPLWRSVHLKQSLEPVSISHGSSGRSPGDGLQS